MIRVACPDNNRIEREYIINQLLVDFMGLDTEIVFNDDFEDYHITYNNYTIIINDSFFSKFTRPLEYLNKENIPSSTVSYLQIQEHCLPIIYGINMFEKQDEKIFCGLDIFASSFYLLTCWEELLLKKEQNVGLFEKVDETTLFLVRNGFYQRCIVNEYIEFLKCLFVQIGISNFKDSHFSAMLTHDVDRCFLSSYEELVRNILGILKKGDQKKAIQILEDYSSYRSEGINPFDSFNELMDLSDSYGLKNYFYFKACEETDKGYTYSISDKFVKDTLQNIVFRGHFVGFHPSENTPNNQLKFNAELKKLQEQITVPVEGGRTHQLIYNSSIYNNFNDAGLVYDSGVGFQYYNGFRSSVCYPYFIFDIENRRKLKIKQYPFMVMDSVSIRNGMSADEFTEDIKKIVDTVKKYRGLFITNWHSNLFNARGRESFKESYTQMLKYLRVIE